MFKSIEIKWRKGLMILPPVKAEKGKGWAKIEFLCFIILISNKY